MFLNKQNCNDTPENFQEPGADEKQSPVEQALSNLVILDIIFNHLNAQDIIRASMVNKSLRGYFLQFLRTNSNKKKKKKTHHPVCIQIRDKNPCRALARFNSYLVETQLERNDQNWHIFDGIQQNYEGRCWKLGYDPVPCTDCLIEDWNHEYKNDKMEKSTYCSNLHTCYGRILEKVKFKYIRFNIRVPTSCPFAMFIKFILSANVEDILELDFGNEYDNSVLCPFYLQNEMYHQKVFPNLEILGICIKPTSWFPITSPALTTIKHYVYDVTVNRIFTLNYIFPFHALTFLILELSLDRIKHLVQLVEKFRVRPQKLGIYPRGQELGQDLLEITQHCEYRQTLFKLGHVVSFSLVDLDSSMGVFTFMASKGFIANLEDDIECKNTFPHLKHLTLTGSLEIDTMDWFCWLELSKNFPKLECFDVTFFPSTSIIEVSGPYNKYHGGVCKLVKTLGLGWDDIKKSSPFDPKIIPSALSLFPCIRTLKITSCPLTNPSLLDVISTILNEIDYMPFLDEMLFVLVSLNDLFLDKVFLEKETLSKWEQVLGEDCLEPAFKSSILNHKQLKKLQFISEGEMWRDDRYSEKPPDRFIVSSSTAQNICKYLPGFEIHLKTTDISNTDEGDGMLEHLEPYTGITTTVSPTPWSWISIHRVIQFIDETTT